MKYIPILYSTPMVQALQAKRKTMTRRIVKYPCKSKTHHVGIESGEPPVSFCPYGEIGDVLWVRESYCYVGLDHAHDLLEGARDNNQNVYKASIHEDWIVYAKKKYGYKWKPAIHMPKEACRMWLEITNIRVERLQDIGELDAVKEGISNNETKYFDYLRKDFLNETAYHSFFTLWQSINGADSWNKNPWVWVIEFKQVDRPEGFLEA